MVTTHVWANLSGSKQWGPHTAPQTELDKYYDNVEVTQTTQNSGKELPALMNHLHHLP